MKYWDKTYGVVKYNDIIICMEENNQEILDNPKNVIRVSKKNFLISILVILILITTLISLFNVRVGFDQEPFIRNLVLFFDPIVLIFVFIFFIWGLIQYLINSNPLVKKRAQFKIIFGIIGIIICIFFLIIASVYNRNDNLSMKERESLSSIDIFYYVLGSPKKINLNIPTFDDSQYGIDTLRTLNYVSLIQTREIDNVTKEVESIIKEYGGQISIEDDSLEYNSGSFTFFIPVNRFDDFRDKIKTLTYKKFYSEIYSKQSQPSQLRIEKFYEYTTKELLAWKDNISTKDKELQNLQSSIEEIKDPLILDSLQAQEITLLQAHDDVQKIINRQKQNYEIQAVNTNVDETEYGQIRVNGLSRWEMAKILFPIPPYLLFLIFSFLILLYLSRKIEFK